MRLVARAPWMWPLMRRSVRGFFDRLADGWDERVRPDAPEHLVALAAAVAHLDAPPDHILDLGTGTGAGALWLAREYPRARVTGVDISEAMIERARAKLSPKLSARVDFLVGDAERLPFADGSFDLVAQISVPVFFDEVARVLGRGGYVVVVSSLGLKTPFHTPPRTRCATASAAAGWRSSPTARRVRASSSWADSPPRPYPSDRAPARTRQAASEPVANPLRSLRR
jgi:SAM-dependent methyltransferase